MIKNRELKKDPIFWALMGCLAYGVYLFSISPHYNIVKPLGNNTTFVSVEYRNITINYTYNVVSVFCQISIPEQHFFYLSGFPLINYTQTVNDLIKKTDPFPQACKP